MVRKIVLIIVVLSIQIFAGTPNWVFNPNVDRNYIGGVGSSSSGNLYRDLKVAKILARADLSQSIAVDIESTFLSHNGKSDYSMVQKSKELLKGSFVKEQWRSPDGELFIWIVIKRDEVEN